MKSRADQRLVRCSQRCATQRMPKGEGELHSAWYLRLFNLSVVQTLMLHGITQRPTVQLQKTFFKWVSYFITMYYKSLCLVIGTAHTGHSWGPDTCLHS